MMRAADVLIGLASFLSLTVPVHSVDATYWVHPGCDKHFPDGLLDKMMNEAMDTAVMIRDRMSRSKQQEPDAHRSFEALFKFPFHSDNEGDKKNAEKFKDQIGFEGANNLFAITKYRKTTLKGEAGRMSSVLRIHCDNGARFKRVDDSKDKTEPESTSNSQRPKDKQEYFDEINKIKTKAKTAMCVRPMMTLSRWSGPNEWDITPEKHIGELPFRSSLTICDEFLNHPDRLNLFGDIPTSKMFGLSNTAKEDLQHMRVIGSIVLLHELSHAWMHLNEDHAYGLNVYRLQKEQAIKNADSFAIMGVVMRTMERKYAPDRDHPDKGIFKWYKDIPDRVKPSKRSVPSGDWLRGKRNTILSCEDGQNVTETGLRCRRFEA